MHQGIKTYANLGNYTAASDADPHTLITMLFDGALERIASAKGAMQAGDIAMKGLMISKAITVVDGLRAHLDLEKGGDIAVNLRNLYDFAENRLFEANFNNSIEMLDEVTKVLNTIKEAWAGIKPVPAEKTEEAGSYE